MSSTSISLSYYNQKEVVTIRKDNRYNRLPLYNWILVISVIQLWAEAEQLLPGSRRLRSRESEKTVFADVEKAISEGNDSKECRLLTSSGMADNVPESLEQLRRLHPQFFKFLP